MVDVSLDISDARKQFTTLDKRLEKEPVIWITRRNKRAFAVVDRELLETIMETIEILSDPTASKMLQQSLEDLRAGRVHSQEDVKRELLQ